MSALKVVIPAAGLGTRFLPTTKTVPKEIFPLVDKPAMQYIIEEGIRAGVRDFISVVSRDKKTIEDYFDVTGGSPTFIHEKGKNSSLEYLNRIIARARFCYVRQGEPLGLGHAVSCAQSLISEPYFGVMLPDDILVSETSGIGQLHKIAMQEKGTVIAVREVPVENISRYGVVAIKKQITPTLFMIKDVIEKPSSQEAPSNLAIFGRYILSKGIFQALDETQEGHGGEVQLTDAIRALIHSGERVFAYKIQGASYDVGTISGWLKANIELSLQHPVYGKEIGEYLRNLDIGMLHMKNKSVMVEK